MGIPEEQLRRAVEKNICKINVDSDSRLAFTAGVRQVLAEQPAVFDPRTYLKVARDNMIKIYEHKHEFVMNSKDRY
jgi:fructose-bisphosphate aldolase class II